MGGSLPLAYTLASFLMAGALLGAAVLHGSWWRGADRRSGAGDTLWWSVALGALCLVNALLHVAPTPEVAAGLTTARFVTFAATFALALPAIRAYTSGPPLVATLVALGLWFLTGVSLIVLTDLVVTSPAPGALPEYGLLDPVITLVPLAFVAVYLALALRGRPVSLVGSVVTGSGGLSALLLIMATALPATPESEVLRGAWVIPLAIGLEVLTAHRMASARAVGARQRAMRDALAAVANLAWRAPTSDDLVEGACREARRVLADPGLEGNLRTLARDRFVVEFVPTADRELDDDERAFLRDLSRSVAGASERQAMTSRLRDTAYTDPLTGLPNRAAVDRHLRTLIERAEVERTRVAVLFVDVEDFKQVNEIRGHAWGDRMLVLVGRHLSEAAPAGSFTARYGGDEFLVVLGRAAPDEELIEQGRALRSDFRSDDDDLHRPSLSVGIAVWVPGDPVDPVGLVREADQAMLEATRSRAGVVLYDDSLEDRFAAQRTVRRELELGIAGWEFVPYFQPITNALTLEVVGVEALARWRHRGELRHPAQWLSVAEDTGLIVEIGRQIFTHARAGSERFDLPVAVNVAPRQLEDPGLIDLLTESWGQDDWQRLTIELTESASLYDSAHVQATLATLVERGVRISLDDFGTGYNSLARLGDLPLHSLKIDRTLVQEVGTPQGAAVVRAMLDLAEAYGLEVIAEGVERAAELTALVDLGVTWVQGFMVGRPSLTLPMRSPDGGWPARAATALPEAVLDRVPGQLRRAASP